MPMKLGQMRSGKPGRGKLLSSGRRSITVSVDEETFDEIFAHAEKTETSLAETLRTLLQWGLDAADQS